MRCPQTLHTEPMKRLSQPKARRVAWLASLCLLAALVLTHCLGGQTGSLKKRGGGTTTTGGSGGLGGSGGTGGDAGSGGNAGAGEGGEGGAD
jgi:hypothetical protein